MQLRFVTFAAAFMIGLSAVPALAQDAPAFDVSGGYSLVRDGDVEETFHGWLASATGYVTPWFGITGEVGGNYKGIEVLGADVDLSVHSFMAGPRLTVRSSAGVTPFAQLLVGAARLSGDVLGIGDSSTEFALQPGGGVDIWLSSRAGIRVGADYRRVFVEDDGINEFRFHVGVVVSGGRR